MRLAPLSLSLALAACTTLGPMPLTTAAPAAPAGRSALELQAGAVPAFHLSSSTRQTEGRKATSQLLALIEPHLAVPGLVLGARGFGESHDRGFEPLLGYRRALGATSGISLVGYGTRMRGGTVARYEATRAGGELAIEGTAGPLLGQLAVAVTRVAASGTYCVDDDGYGVDCGTDDDVMVNGRLEGFYPAVTAGAGVDLAGKLGRHVHRARLALHASIASMPRLQHGVQTEAEAFFTMGITLTLGLAAARDGR